MFRRCTLAIALSIVSAGARAQSPDTVDEAPTTASESTKDPDPTPSAARPSSPATASDTETEAPTPPVPEELPTPGSRLKTTRPPALRPSAAAQVPNPRTDSASGATLKLALGPNLTLHANGRVLCGDGCAVGVTPGNYRVALALPGEKPRYAGTVHIQSDTTLEGYRRSRAPLRAAMGSLSAVGLTTGLGFLGRGARLLNQLRADCESVGLAGVSCGSSVEAPAKARLIGGAVASLTGALTGIIALVARDEVEVRIRPRTLTPGGNSVAAAVAPPSEPEDTLERLLPELRECADEEELAHLRLYVDESGRAVQIQMPGRATHKACVLDVLRGHRFPEGHPGVLSL